ncbi:MAG: exodeoxyribonuclease VII large subunit [Butyrivibrio sp.]|nr:exodeoxyribonuclease VII large subunit [Butyrivibrio sp.]
MAKIYSVEQVNSYIKNMFSTDFVLNKISVEGEVSNCKYHSSGHIYFTIKDSKNSLAAVMFAANRGGLDFKLEDGMKIVATGSIAVYERDGKYSLYAKKIERAGRGELYEKFLALKDELEGMGMFDEMFKQPIPAYVRKLGVVTAQTGAAIQDIINISRRRNPYIQIVLCPALVQGDGAAASICEGIARLDAYGVDVIIVGRGGGSMEDLWAFNEEAVARAIFECRTPVISAVGHETDFTIADFAADLRAPTPSAAAELAVRDLGDTMRRIAEYARRISELLSGRTDSYRSSLEVYRVRLEALSPLKIINSRRRELERLKLSLERAVEAELSRAKNRLSVSCARLEALSPLLRLTGGYSYVADRGGKAVTSVSGIKAGDILDINVSDGIIKSKVLEASHTARAVPRTAGLGAES